MPIPNFILVCVISCHSDLLLIAEALDNVIDFFNGDCFLVRFGIDDEQDETSG